MQFQAKEVLAELSTEQIRSALPSQVHALLEVVSVESALNIIQEYGGLRLYVPLDYPPDHEMLTLVSADEAGRLSYAYGGMDHFDIPRCIDLMRLVRNRKMHRLYMLGMSLRELARKFGASERGIQKIVSQYASPNSQRLPVSRKRIRCPDRRIDERNKRICELLAAGVPKADLAKQFKLHAGTIHWIVKRLQPNLLKKQSTAERNKAIVQLSAAGASFDEIAMQFNLSKPTIKTICRPVKQALTSQAA